MTESNEKKKAELQKRLEHAVDLHDGALSAHKMHQEMYDNGKGAQYKKLASRALVDAGKYEQRINEIKAEITRLDADEPSQANSGP